MVSHFVTIRNNWVSGIYSLLRKYVFVASCHLKSEFTFENFLNICSHLKKEAKRTIKGLLFTPFLTFNFNHTTKGLVFNAFSTLNLNLLNKGLVFQPLVKSI